MKPARAGCAAIMLLIVACHAPSPNSSQANAPVGPRDAQIKTQDSPPLVAAARGQIGVTRLYDPAYVEMHYPDGDAPADRGVCTGVVVRALRVNGLDLQQVIHEDMRSHFDDYPQNWGLNGPNRNIDHRRVPNQMRWFERQGWAQPISGLGRRLRGGRYRGVEIIG